MSEISEDKRAEVYATNHLAGMLQFWYVAYWVSSIYCRV